MKDIPLRLVCNELTSDGRDGRDGIGSLPTEKLFFLLSGETEQSFCVGSLVLARVIRIFEGQKVLTKLDNGLLGVINGPDFSDNAQDIEVVRSIIEEVRAARGRHA